MATAGWDNGLFLLTTNCEAADSVKPRARLCEGIYIVDSPESNKR